MFDEKRLDAHGVGNLTEVLTIKFKTSTFRVRGRVDSVRITNVKKKKTSLPLVKFQTKEGAGKT